MIHDTCKSEEEAKYSRKKGSFHSIKANRQRSIGPSKAKTECREPNTIIQQRKNRVLLTPWLAKKSDLLHGTCEKSEEEPKYTRKMETLREFAFNRS